MKLSVVIPTRGDQNMKNIVACLQRQTFKDFEVIFVVDKKIENYELWSKDYEFLHHNIIRCITNITHTIIYNNASVLRNLGIKEAKGQFIQLMDDDEQFDDDYLENSLMLRHHYHDKLHKDFVLTPTLMYRKTGQIQNQGFSRFNYVLSRPIPQILGDKPREYIQMYSGNSLLAPAHIFKTILFDEHLDFVYEDLEFTYRIYRAGYPIIVLRDLKIYHMERDKTSLEHLWIGNQYAAYRKSKHKMIFIRKNASTANLFAFYLFGFLGHPVWLTLHLLKYPFQKHTFSIIISLWKGVFDGLFCPL